MKLKNILLIVMIFGILGISTVQAAQPNNQACVGESVSKIAQENGRLFGQGVSSVATNPEILEIFGIDIDNLGEGVQALLAGDIPDVPVNGIYVENTCNN